MLKCLAASLESRQTFINALPPPPHLRVPINQFVGEEAREVKVKVPDTGHLGGACDWMLLANLNQRLCFPPETIVTKLRPDLVLWSSTLRTVYIIELIVSWEDAVEEAYERKSLKYTELAGNVGKRGWKDLPY